MADSRAEPCLPEPSPANRLRLVRALAFGAVLAVCAGFAWRSGFGTPAFSDRLTALLADLGPWAPIGFAALKIATVVLALPAAPVAMAGGALFGPVWGTLANLLAATIGAILTFFLGRRLGREEVEARLGDRLRALDERLARDGLRVMLFLRLVPLFPFTAINYGSGLTRIRFRDYFWGTLFGMAPGAAAFSWLGHAAAGRSATGVVLGLMLLGALAILPLFWRGR